MKANNLVVVDCTECAFIRAIVEQYRTARAAVRCSKDKAVQDILKTCKALMRLAVLNKDVSIATQVLSIVLSLQQAH